MMHKLRTALGFIGAIAVAVLTAMIGVAPSEVRANAVTFNQEIVDPQDQLAASSWQLTSFIDENQSNRAPTVAIKRLADLGGVGIGVGSFTLAKVKYSSTLGAHLRASATPPTDINWKDLNFPVAFSNTARPPNIAKIVLDGA